VGLNITAASKVIIVDPWWNTSIEQQAFCRVFRIGQKEETFLSKFCARGTVDQHIIKTQKRKQEEIDSVMEADGSQVKK
jgi:SNF2 family DNA or RNA helicase